GRPPGRLADLGGGVGYFARCALDQGWDAYSIDVSPLAVAAAGERIGPQRSFVAPPAHLLGTCDVVTLWCVVAHVNDPRSILIQALNLLKPGGRLLITTPNLVFQLRYIALLARLGRPIDFREHDHLLHYSPTALRTILRQAGVDRVSYTYFGVHEDCVAHRGLAPVVVPLKRIWNRVAVAAQRRGLPLWSSELQAVAIKR
ncbi:MAG: class I SAM-dependent methyltransferase, partial [Pseudonocardiaceae bacterium]